MSSLADLPEIVGFFSYSRDDDEDFGRQLSSLRDAIQKELAAALGRRNKRDFRLWQDQDAIAPGEMWETKIAAAINEATFFIPIVTPRAIGSEHCKFEFNAFVVREAALGRKNLIFPILYITVPALTEDSRWRNDPVLSVVGARRFVDWRKHRHAPIESPAYREAVSDFCAKIGDALREPWASAEQRSRQEADARLRQEAELRNRAKEEARRQQAEEERARQEADKRKLAQEEADRAVAASTKDGKTQQKLEYNPSRTFRDVGNYHWGRLFLFFMLLIISSYGFFHERSTNTGSIILEIGLMGVSVLGIIYGFFIG